MRRTELGQTAGAAVVGDVLDIVVAEALDAAQNHVGGFVADGTVCGVRDGFRRLFNAVDGFQCCTLAEDIVHQACELSETDAAGGTFAAGLCMAQLQEAEGNVNGTQSRGAGGDTPLQILVQALDNGLCLIRGFQT